MKRDTVKYITLVLLSAAILALGRLASGILAELVIFIGFALPVLIGHRFAAASRREREEELGRALPPDRSFCLSRSELGALLPIIAPTVTAVMLISWVTGLVLSSLGMEPPHTPEGSFFTVFLASCLAPAVLEEMFFRYLSLRLVAPHSVRWAIIISALTFALFHGSLYSVPYAFAAGLVFMAVDVAFGSVIPSFILHLVNNTFSLLLSSFEKTEWAIAACCSVLFVSCAVGAVLLVVKRKKYRILFSKGAERISYGRR